MNKIKLSAMAALLFIGADYARAERLVTDEKALQDMLPGSESVEKVARPVTAEEVTAVKKQLGGALTDGGKSAADPKEFVFYFGMKGGKKTGAAMLDSQPGKWGVIGFAVGVDAETGKIVGMAVTTMSEKRGRPIALKSFLKQFFGKDKTAAFTVGKDVNAVAGATVSTRAAAFAARKAVVLYNALFLKK
jgi:Na+-translocating ferredoxin:NAD+ oxidoreductase RnfG subunit